MNDSLLKALVWVLHGPGPHISQLYRPCSQPTTLTALNPCSTPFATIPTTGTATAPLPSTRATYASIFYSHFAALGLDIRLEDATNQGRIDMTVLFNGHVFIRVLRW